MDIANGKLTMIYDDPALSDFEARPLQPRPIPRQLAIPAACPPGYTAHIFCSSVYTTQEKEVARRGRFLRVVEGEPPMARHQTHMNGGIAWKNHGGTVGRVLGIVPLAPDGSFYVEVPADHLFHLQVLDADRQVIGNELIWQYARPGESKGCVGCHESPDVNPKIAQFPAAMKRAALPCLPTGDEFRYRAKLWVKGSVPQEHEQRLRTVNSIHYLGRE